jgi:hypothetical protein
MNLQVQNTQSVQDEDLFVEKIEPERIEDDESKAQRLATELAQTQCDLCNQHISSSNMSKSLRLPDCRHFLSEVGQVQVQKVKVLYLHFLNTDLYFYFVLCIWV